MAQGCGGNPAPFAYLGRELGLQWARKSRGPGTSGAGKVPPGFGARVEGCMTRRLGYPGRRFMSFLWGWGVAGVWRGPAAAPAVRVRIFQPG